MEGIQKKRGVDELTASKRVPDCRSVGGFELRSPSWYQREPSRSPAELPAPLALTRLLCAVQSESEPPGPLAIIASKKRSSRASSPPVVPSAGTGSGWAVAGIVTIIGLVIAGVPPGSVMRRTSSRLERWVSGPTMYPALTAGSAVVAGCGLSGPCDSALVTVRKPVTTIGPPLVTLDFRTT